MNWALKILLIYLLCVNLLTFILFGIDKLKAKKSKWRIKESTLLGFAFAGGSVGALLGMYVWHHKTLHKKFIILVPLFLLLHISATIYFLFFN